MKVLVFSFLMLVAAARSPAQTADRGSMEGTITDPSGAAVPDVSLRVRNLGTSVTFFAATDEGGSFRFPVLSVGTYELVAERAGFATLIQENLSLTVGAKINLALRLTLATKAETVVVSGRNPLVETTRSRVSFTVNERSIESLPANGRNFLDFVLLTPGVTRGSRGFDLSFAGQRKMNLLTVDGSDNDNTFFMEVLGTSGSGFAPYQFSMATVREFQVNTNNYSAENGRVGAGLVNVATKSGTNHLRGGAFWYYRDKSMNATDLINKINSEPKSPFHFNQFGGTLGGPFRKDKLFFFGNYDGQRSAAQNLTVLNLPSGFVFSPDPSVAAFQRKALDYLVARSRPWLRTFDQNVYFAKVDWNISRAHLLTARWNGQRFWGGGLEDQGPQVSFEHTGASVSNTDTVAFSLTSTLSASLMNVARFSFVRSDEPGFADSPNPEASVSEGGQLVLRVGRRPISPRENAIRRGQWSNTLSYLRGRHALKTGGDLLVDRIRFFTAVNFSGSYRFRSLESFGRSLAGVPSPALGEFYRQAFSGTGGRGTTVHPDFVEYAGFVQDEWRLRPGLAFNLGGRYDLQTLAQPKAKNPSAELAAAGLDTSFAPTDENNFAPRLGFAWSPLASHRLVVRGGYGIFYWRTPSILSSRAHFQNGVSVQTISFLAGTQDAAFLPAYPDTLCGPPDPLGAPPNCAAPAGTVAKPLLMIFPHDYVQPYTQQGNFGIEYQVQKDTSVFASYLWVHGSHLERVRDINLGLPTTPTTIAIANTRTFLTHQKFTRPRPFAEFDRITLLESGASSVYHALAVQVKKRFSHNFELTASYTWGKVIDDAPDPSAIEPGSPGSDSRLLSDASNARADRASGASDVRHRFVVNGIWELNYAGGLPAAARAVLTGWEASGIFTAQSGPPYSGMVDFDLNNDGNSNNDRTPGLGRNTFYLPGTVSFDPRLTRNVRLTEHASLQFIWEAFNVLNRANITAVETTQFSLSASFPRCGIADTPCLIPQASGRAAFGRPTTTAGPRIMQLSVRLVF